MLAVNVRTDCVNEVGKDGDPPMTMTTAMVSPKARPLARTIAERMPCLAAGTTVVNTPMLRVTPSAIAPCR